MIIWSTHNRGFTKNCKESIKRWRFLLWWSRTLVILRHSSKCMDNSTRFRCFATLSLILDIGFPCIVGSTLFTVLYGSTSFSRVAWTLSLSEILSECRLMFSVGVIKLESWMYIMLVRKSSFWTIWIPSLPIPSSGGQIDAFSRSQRAHQSRTWRTSA